MVSTSVRPGTSTGPTTSTATAPPASRTPLADHPAGSTARAAAATSRGLVAAARARVQLAKTGLGERGQKWWEQSDDERRARWEDALAALDDLD